MADFNTIIKFKGSVEEYIKLTEVLRFYVEDRYEQYKKEGNCWYLEGTIDNECPAEGEEKTMSISGPYGVWNGPISDEIDLFERIADEIPNGYFKGTISGFNGGEDEFIEAELKNGLLYCLSNQERFYNPKTHEYGERENIIESEHKVYDVLNKYKEILNDSNKKEESKRIIGEILPLFPKEGVRNLLLFEGDKVVDPGAVKYLNDNDFEKLATHLYFMCERASGSIYTQICSLAEKIIDYNINISEEMDGKVPTITWKTKKIDDKKARIISCTVKSYREETIDLIIPNEINGFKITEIEPNIFDMSKYFKDKVTCDGLSKITSITYPKGIKKVPDTGSYTVRKVFFEGKPTSIGDLGDNLIDFEIPESVKNIDKYAFESFQYDNIILPPKLEKICEKAFYYSNLKKIIIPVSVKKIEEDAFRYSKLKKIVLQATSIKVDDTAFRGCELLEDIIIESDSFVVTGYRPQNPFEGCVNLKRIVCRNDVVAEEIIKLSDDTIKSKVIVERKI